MTPLTAIVTPGGPLQEPVIGSASIQPPQPVKLSIIIVSWNVREFVQRCLQSIRENVRGLEYEVILVDNASRDGSVQMVERGFPEVRVIANPENVGFCAGNNQGLAVASGDLIVLLNPDTEVRPGAFEILAGYLCSHKDVGIVGPFLESPEGISMPNGNLFPTVRRELLGMSGLHQRFRRQFEMAAHGRSDFTVLAEVDVVCGACLFMRRQVYDQIGGLDEALFMFYEETDFCRRARDAGWRVSYIPQARVFHHWGKSVNQDYLRAMKRHFRSQYLYFRKHHGAGPAMLLRTLSAWTLLFRGAKMKAVRLRDWLRTRIRPAGPT